MKTRTKILSAAITAVIGAHTATSYAALPANAILQFTAGVVVCNAAAGTPPNNCTYGTNVSSGSFFSMDTNGNGTVQNGEKVAISPLGNIILGTTQPASGTHSGQPDTTESPGIDQPWSFFGNTGMHQTTAAITVASDDNAGNVTLNFTGWNVTWNSIASIPMGGDTANFPVDTGIATMTCGSTCAIGDTFTLVHAAHVPLNDPSNFGGVQYVLNLTGTIDSAGQLSCSGCTSVVVGTTASNAGSLDGRISMNDIVADGKPADTGYSYGGGLYDFIANAVTLTSEQILIPLTAPIPANAVYRKLNNAVWAPFVVDGNNLIASAPRVTGICPAAGDVAYDHLNGLVAGETCLQLTIVDDGPNDADATTIGTIADPGGVATANQISVDTRVSSTSGCSLANTTQTAGNHADWWLVAAFIALLGLIRRKATISK